MKNLIVYYSFSENNEKLANHLRAILRCDIVRIETLKKHTGFSIFLDLLFNRTPAIKTVPYYLRDYDHVIFVSPIWAGKVAMPLKSFLINEKANIKRYTFVTLCGGGNTNQKGKIKNELQEMTSKAPVKVVELWMSEFLAAKKKADKKNVTGYRINPEELEHFGPQINEVLEQMDLLIK
jgi:flavodoxin